MAVANLRAKDILVSHRSEISKVLTVSETTLLSLTVKLYEKQIVDDLTKAEIISQTGVRAANTLLDLIELRVKYKPQLLHTVFDAMKENMALKDIVEQMENWKSEDIDMQGKM